MIDAQQPLLELIEGTHQSYIWDIVQLMSELAYSSYIGTYKPRHIISPWFLYYKYLMRHL